MNPLMFILPCFVQIANHVTLLMILLHYQFKDRSGCFSIMKVELSAYMLKLLSLDTTLFIMHVSYNNNELFFLHLHNYFNLCICLSIWCRHWRPVPLPILVVESPNVPNESDLVCVKSKKYAFLVILRPLGSISSARQS